MTKEEIKKYEEMASEVVKARPGGCEVCGAVKEYYHCAHIRSKTKKTTRFHLPNLLKTCVSCHIFFMHKDPLAFDDWLIKNKGQKFRDNLLRRGNQVKRPDLVEEDLKTLEIEYQKIQIE